MQIKKRNMVKFANLHGLVNMVAPRARELGRIVIITHIVIKWGGLDSQATVPFIQCQ